MNITKELVTSNILTKIMEIDNNFYSDSITPFSWYDRYNDNEVILLRDKFNEIVGYLIIVGIEEKLYDAFCNKILVGDVCINPKLFNYRSSFKYLASIVIKDPYQHKGYGSKMMKFALENQNSGNKIIAISVSEGGYNILKNTMTCTGNIDSKIKLFEFIK